MVEQPPRCGYVRRKYRFIRIKFPFVFRPREEKRIGSGTRAVHEVDSVVLVDKRGDPTGRWWPTQRRRPARRRPLWRRPGVETTRPASVITTGRPVDAVHRDAPRVDAAEFERLDDGVGAGDDGSQNRDDESRDEGGAASHCNTFHSRTPKSRLRVILSDREPSVGVDPPDVTVWGYAGVGYPKSVSLTVPRRQTGRTALPDDQTSPGHPGGRRGHRRWPGPGRFSGGGYRGREPCSLR